MAALQHRIPIAVPTVERSAFAGQSIYLIGIGGCGMSGLARLLQSLGAKCAGSDSVASDLTRSLVLDNIPVSFDQAAGRLPDRCDRVIASAAIRPDHPEALATVASGIPLMTYAEALGAVQREHTGISIAGTHGKSTTAAMLCHILIDAGLNPNFIIGAQCPQIGGGARTGAAAVPGSGALAGQPGLFVAEACEFNRSFHHHRPTIGLINNVEEDHLDIYGSLDNIIRAFAEFAQLIPHRDAGGHLVVAHDGAHRREITAGLTCGITTFGLSNEADFKVFVDHDARRVGLFQDGFLVTQWTNAMAGEHNALNTAGAAILAHLAGAPWDVISESLGSFSGLDRRMQNLGTRAVADGVVTVYDDYGHHPTEIERTLKALRVAERPQRLICVFQPHQHSRTRFLLEEFARSFSSADIVIVPEIYFVRDSENEKQRISAQDLVDRLCDRGINAMHLTPFDTIVEHLVTECRGNDLVVIMGAGPVWQIAHQFVQTDVQDQGTP